MPLKMQSSKFHFQWFDFQSWESYSIVIDITLFRLEDFFNEPQRTQRTRSKRVKHGSIPILQKSFTAFLPLRSLRLCGSFPHSLIPANNYTHETGILNVYLNTKVSLTSFNPNLPEGFCVHTFTFCNVNYFL